MNGSPIPSATSASPNHNGSSLMNIDGKRILCTADVRGNISQLNVLAREANADYIIHTGDFGFYDRSSLDRISDRTLKHLVQYSTLIPPTVRKRLNGSPIEQVRPTIEQSPQPFLSEFPEFLGGKKTLEVPVYAVWGACEDVAVLERFRSGEYRIPNLYILDEATTYLLEVGGISLRLFGLGGAVVQHKLFDNGEGSDTIAGGSGTMWTTALQIGELVETANEVYDQTEIRVLVTHASPGREGLLAQLALVLRADFTISAGLHFRYGISYNEFACQPDQEHYRERLYQSQQGFMQLWDAIKAQVENHVDVRQAALLKNALTVVNRLPPSRNAGQPDMPVSYTASSLANDEQAFKNMWNFNLPDAAFGWLVLDVSQGRVSAETRSQGFNFSYRKGNAQQVQAGQTSSPAMSTTGVVPPSANPMTYTEKPNQYRPNDWQQQQQQQQPMDANTNSDGDWKDNGSSKDEKFNSGNNSVRNSKRMSMQRSPYAIYVGGLTNNNVNEDDIREFFGADKITGVRFPLDQMTQQPKSHCYVDLVDPIALEGALQKSGDILKGNKLIVNRPNAPDGRNRGGRNGRGRSYRGGRGNRDSIQPGDI
ncbi:hypothetical protein BDB00DRAFT_226710 [Zychaea mexicana]|uniref:uncharacterized protein n=1 Tax=Zychaea mexicana TaxID=64656 RepID=UPI0022FE2800|nr:uncharacterized protein BDB00DRAFT_226710 [Zychaea mexicana]KAI9499272.1 hypothetical protein BDB00DRAFT_226710 [Zychaea mexicana]